ncbi:hypothetical protein [Lacticaseibacillus brantae]|uniref:Integral membrane protein n=1 Tax=Lacticaseibacillus brantae DSM 23927 TaxID=1423727 RepID=A0A0R2BAY7_9LACO|nr:hypothetical protein [Lacticaseibacillus brantae]KRM72787.1 hypothetical protein FC34_GL000498 [Lacticaseibacillus brantae DSM 23927]
MVAAILYWGVIAALIGWGLWNILFSIIYVHNHENGNLWFFAILNTLTLIFGGIFMWVMNNAAWQRYWFTTGTKTSPILGYLLIAYIVLVVLQVIFGREGKQQTA